jgi:hypothetical protein
MTEAFNRRVNVKIGDPFSGFSASGGGPSDFRISFAVERDTKPWPNNAEVAIWGLSPETRSKALGKKEITCQILAGYEGSVKQIFLGIMRRAWLIRDKADVVLRLSAGDGEKSGTATIATTFATGTPVSAILAALVTATGIQPGNLAEVADARFDAGNVMVRPFTVAGPALEELASFARSAGLSWSVQDGAFQFLRLAAPFLVTMGPFVSPDSGLIGSPTQEYVSDKDHPEPFLVTSGRCLLLPDLRPGQKFTFAARDSGGILTCKSVKHTGDTNGNDWFTDWTGE